MLRHRLCKGAAALRSEARAKHSALQALGRGVRKLFLCRPGRAAGTRKTRALLAGEQRG